MGFFSNLWNKAKQVGQAVWERGKQFVREVANDVKEIFGSKPEPPEIKVKTTQWVVNPGDPTPGDIIARNNAYFKMLNEYQSRVKTRADNREKEVQEAYERTYREIVRNLEDCGCDVSNINHYIKKKKAKFTNVMSKDVNTKVSPEYDKWKSLRNNPSTTDEEIRAYTERVFIEADNKLLDKLISTIKETNTFIENVVNKYQKDRENAILITKETLINLTKDKDSKMKELQKIMEEYASMAFIQHEAEKEI